MRKIKRKIKFKNFFERSKELDKFYLSNRKYRNNFPNINSKEVYILFSKPCEKSDDVFFHFTSDSGKTITLKVKDFKYINIYELL